MRETDKRKGDHGHLVITHSNLQSAKRTHDLAFRPWRRCTTPRRRVTSPRCSSCSPPAPTSTRRMYAAPTPLATPARFRPPAPCRARRACGRPGTIPAGLRRASTAPGRGVWVGDRASSRDSERPAPPRPSTLRTASSRGQRPLSGGSCRRACACEGPRRAGRASASAAPPAAHPAPPPARRAGAARWERRGSRDDGGPTSNTARGWPSHWLGGPGAFDNSAIGPRAE